MTALAGIFVVGVPGAGAAEATHVFDATLSLTGSCSSKLTPPDTVPDPGCPGGSHPPGGPFKAPAIAVDNFGDMYVASFDPPHEGEGQAQGSKGRVDVFSPSGTFITEFSVPRIRELAIDSEGNVYAYLQSTVEGSQSTELKLYRPSTYNPALSVIAYNNAPSTLPFPKVPGGPEDPGRELENGIAVSRANDHLFVDRKSRIMEYSAASEGNVLLPESIGIGALAESKRIALDVAHNRIYASDSSNEGANSVVRVFELNAPHKLLATFDGSTTPLGKFFTATGRVSIATEESTGNFFVDDSESKEIIYEFSSTGALVSSIKPSNFHHVNPSQIETDNGPTSPNRGTLYVPSGESEGHTFAFVPNIVGAPKIESLDVKNVASGEAEVTAAVIPRAPAPEYVLEYMSQQQFEAEGGFVAGIVVAQGQLPSGKEPVELSASLSGLSQGTGYRVRLVVVNEKGSDSKEVSLTTFEEPSSASCPNDAARVGPSAQLPDCRAYELVTPPDTGGKSPLGIGNQFAGPLLGTQAVTEDGSSVAFIVVGGLIPGFEGGGNFNGDGYLSLRGPAGWTTQSIALNGTQSAAPQPGALSPDHLFEAVVAGPPGPFALEGRETVYLRYPNGTFQPLGRGSLGVQAQVQVLELAAKGSHVLFSTRVITGSPLQLEPNAPPDGTVAIYDRPASEEVTHVVSLLPGDVTPGANENAIFRGASADGSAVAFEFNSGSNNDLYVRVNNSVTLDAAPPASTFEGFSANGRYLFYLNQGNITRLDTATDQALSVTSSGDATVVSVASSGSAVFFLSPTDLTPGEPNPIGDEATETLEPGAENLYVWREGTVQFIATVTKADIEGEKAGGNGAPGNGLGLWAAQQATEQGGGKGTFNRVPARATVTGATFVFESRADVTGFESGGHSEIYRYADDGTSLTCVSCAPSNERPTRDAHLQTVFGGPLGVPIGENAQIESMAANGGRVVFESDSPLVQSDTNGRQDVYEWESAGTGSCVRANGCIFLLSSGRSAAPSYLFGASASGDDVFILTSDQLVGADSDPTSSIYDARVLGGTAPSNPTSCLGEGCRGQLSTPPALAGPTSTVTGPSGNVPTSPNCAKGKKKVKQHSKSKCVTKHKKHKRKHSRNKGKGGPK